MASRPAKRSRSNDDEPVSSMGETDVDVDAFSFVWTINNYSTQIELGAVESPVFRGSPKNNYGWQVELYKLEFWEDTISFRLKLIDRGNEDSEDEDGENVDVRAKIRFSIIDADGQPFFQEGPGTEIIRFSRPNKQWEYDNFAPADLLYEKPNLAVDDKVKILCKIWIYGDSKKTVMKCREARFNPSQEDRFRKDGIADDLGKLFKESIGTDVTILCSKTNFKAHKLILSARSTVFAAMFNTDMLENRSNFVEISDFEDDVIKGMLEHLYTDETNCMDERAQDLLKIAEKYDLGGLKADCVYELGNKLNLENAGELLILAKIQNAPDLKARAMDFISLNKDKLLKSKSFQDAVKLVDKKTLQSCTYLNCRALSGNFFFSDYH